MGHCQMLLAVAGLDEETIRERTRRIASGDWSSFPRHEAVAFAFAHKLTKEPAKVSGEDIHKLVETFGANRAADLIWYVAWCNYMNRVADAFQLPLETENVFARPPAAAPSKATSTEPAR